MTSKPYILLIGMTLLFTGCADTSESQSRSDKENGSWNIIFVDSITGQEIPEGKIIINETKQAFEIRKSSHIVSLPNIASLNSDGEFQMGYTALSYAKGYLPRIDHNLLINSNDTLTLQLELQPIGGNEAFTEYFHPSSMNAATDYLGSIPYE